MQVKKSSSGLIQYRANRRLVQANRQSQVNGASNKELVEAASKIQVTRHDPVQPSHVPFQEMIPSSPPPEELAAKVLMSGCYLEKQQQNGSQVRLHGKGISKEVSNGLSSGQSVSCFRSTGSVNIPTRRCSTVEQRPRPPPPPRKASLPATYTATTVQLVRFSLSISMHLS